MKVLSFVGARPQFIKLAPIDHELRKIGFEHIIVHSGQHYDKNMSDVFFNELDITPPHYNLEVGSASHGVQTARMMERFEEVVKDVKPEAILLYGDTNTTVAGSLVASKMLVPVVHVEAGLRSYSKRNPEEINRVVTDAISDMLLVPAKRYANILKGEGKTNILSGGELWDYSDVLAKIPVVANVGDVMYDAMLFVLDKVDEGKILSNLGLSAGSYVYMTIHRPYNTDDKGRLEAIIREVTKLSKDVPVVFAVHPRTEKKIREYGLDTSAIKVISPQPFATSVVLQKNARLIITDSGGITKESFILGTRALIVRDEVEWIETVETGFHKLVSPNNIADMFFLISSERKPVIEENPYGDGRASLRIVKLLRQLVQIYPY